jgi:hypothetical protein
MLQRRMANLGRSAAYEMVEKAPLTGLSFSLPTSFSDLVPIADQIDAQFWSRGDRKERFIWMTLERLGIDPKRFPDLTARANSCRSYEDLRELELSLSTRLP